MTPPPLPDELLATLPPAARAYLRALETVAAALTAQVARLTVRVAELEHRLGQNSANSSRPPSSDGPHVKPAPPKTPSGKAKGGQPGHPWNERPLLPPDAVVELRPAAYPDGRHALAGDDPEPLAHQVVELPPVRPHVTEYRRHRLACPRCGRLACAELPAKLLPWLRPPSRYRGATALSVSTLNVATYAICVAVVIDTHNPPRVFRFEDRLSRGAEHFRLEPDSRNELTLHAARDTGGVCAFRPTIRSVSASLV